MRWSPAFKSIMIVFWPIRLIYGFNVTIPQTGFCYIDPKAHLNFKLIWIARLLKDAEACEMSHISDLELFILTACVIFQLANWATLPSASKPAILTKIPCKYYWPRNKFVEKFISRHPNRWQCKIFLLLILETLCLCAAKCLHQYFWRVTELMQASDVFFS